MTDKSRVALVTGAAGHGMGRSIALTLAREGHHVVVNYRTGAAGAAAIVDAIAARGGHAIAVGADVTQPGDCQSLVDAARDAFGTIDTCIIGPGGGWHPEPIEDLDAAGALDDAQRELAPLYHLMPLVLPAMYERNWGRLIGIAQHPTMRSPAYAYNVGKAARRHALGLAESAAWPHNVTVNVISPGPVAPIADLETAVELCDHGPAWVNRDNVTPQDIAEGVALLCSDAGRFLTGSEICYAFH
jgi:NAD(P)-dependent dehydrogenase (short-subunit alcohol dehydrogenase family)